MSANVNLYTVLLSVIVSTYVGCGVARPAPAREDGISGARVFLSHPGYLDNPMEPAEYAKRLLAAPDGEAYVVLILSGNAAFEEATARPLANEEPAVQSVVESFQLAYVVAIIEALPARPSPAVLWALTDRLDDVGVARWSLHPEEGTHVLWESRPVRELARAALAKRLHVDHAYDKSPWRRAIQKWAGVPDHACRAKVRSSSR